MAFSLDWRFPSNGNGTALTLINPSPAQLAKLAKELGIKLPKTIPPSGCSRILMSVAMLSRVWKHSKARLGDRLVLLALADFANDHGEAWPSVETLAKKSRLSERETQYALRRLERSGELKVLPNKGPRGCNVYQITATEGVQNLHGCNICTGAVYDKRGAVYDTKGVQGAAPEPSIEPSIEPSLSLARPSADAAASAESILSRAQEDAFAAFWSAYPKKRGKLDAKRAWKARKPPLQKVLNTLAGLSASHEWRKDNGQFIPYPASWLNAGGWDDEPASVAPPPESFI